MRPMYITFVIRSPHSTVIDEEVATSPEAHFHVRRLQNYPENILLFLQRHLGNPAIKVSTT
jgi:hypothetical protein